MKKLTYFVPVDFSECSFNALQYATMMAKFSEGSVKLCHVIDLDELPESSNPVVVSFALDRLQQRAAEKMRSLKEMISLEGMVGEDEIVTGNLRVQLLKQIETVKPDFIVIGKNSNQQNRHDLVTFLTKNTHVPVLVVPRSHHPKIQQRAVLVTDLKPEKIAAFAPLFAMVKGSVVELNIVTLQGTSATNAALWEKLIFDRYGVCAKIAHQPENYNRVDLWCTSSQPSFLSRLFNRQSPNHPMASSVPVLVFNTSKIRNTIG